MAVGLDYPATREFKRYDIERVENTLPYFDDSVQQAIADTFQRFVRWGELLPREARSAFRSGETFLPELTYHEYSSQLMDVLKHLSIFLEVLEREAVRELWLAEETRPPSDPNGVGAPSMEAVIGCLADRCVVRTFRVPAERHRTARARLLLWRERLIGLRWASGVVGVEGVRWLLADLRQRHPRPQASSPGVSRESRPLLFYFTSAHLRWLPGYLREYRCQALDKLVDLATASTDAGLDAASAALWLKWIAHPAFVAAHVFRDVNFHPAVADLLAHQVAVALPRFVSQELIVRRLVEQYQPVLALSSADVGRRHTNLIRCLQASGVKVMTVLHGLSVPNDDTLALTAASLLPVRADFPTCGGEGYARFCRQHGRDCAVVGNPQFMLRQSMRRRAGKRRLAVFPNDRGPWFYTLETYDECLASVRVLLEELTKIPDVEVVLKPRTVDELQAYRDLEREFPRFKAVFVPLTRLIQEVDIVAAYSTSAIPEALSNGVVVVLYDFHGRPTYYTPYQEGSGSELGVLPTIRRREDVAPVVARLLEPEAVVDWRRRAKVLEREFNVPDPNGLRSYIRTVLTSDERSRRATVSLLPRGT